MAIYDFETSIDLARMNKDIEGMYRIISEPQKNERGDITGYTDEFAIDRAIALYKAQFRNVDDLLFIIRQEMTSITRYVRCSKEKYPKLTEGQFIDRQLEYKALAEHSVEKILNIINPKTI